MIPLIKDIKFKTINYSKLRPKNMLIYCDPPYNKQQNIFKFDFN